MENLDIEKLINEIHLRPAIWDMRSEDYSNKIKKKSSWEEVTDAFMGEVFMISDNNSSNVFF